jgi:hypothetical protein
MVRGGGNEVGRGEYGWRDAGMYLGNSFSAEGEIEGL